MCWGWGASKISTGCVSTLSSAGAPKEAAERLQTKSQKSSEHPNIITKNASAGKRPKISGNLGAKKRSIVLRISHSMSMCKLYMYKKHNMVVIRKVRFGL